MFKHQGDVPFHPYKGKIIGEFTKHNGSVVLALGEQTGHKHIISVPNVEDMTIYRLADGGWIVDLRGMATVTHEEHGSITIAPGLYRVGKEREVDHFADSVVRQVVD